MLDMYFVYKFCSVPDLEISVETTVGDVGLLLRGAVAFHDIQLYKSMT